MLTQSKYNERTSGKGLIKKGSNATPENGHEFSRRKSGVSSLLEQRK